MTDDIQSPVVTPPDASGGGDGKEPKKDTVSYETYQKVLAEKKRNDEKLKALEAEKAAREQKELEDKGEYQKLLDQAKEQLTKSNSELDTLRKQNLDRLKLSHLLDAIDGEVPSKFYPYLDIDDIAVNPDTGEIDKTSVAKAAEKLRKGFPEFIQTKKPAIPNGAPQGGANKISRAEWLKLPSKEMLKYSPDQVID